MSIKLLFGLLFIIAASLVTQPVWAQTTSTVPYVLEQDAQVAKEQTGPHDGGGKTVGYSFFDGVKDYKTAFKKRTLLPGSAIGYHLQQEDEVYYIISGTGEMTMNGKTFLVKPGDAILTRPGSSHGIKPTANQELTLIIVYPKN
ncbi:cupin domain-containing protein [Adhaeribacter swui]|uniref:Cupin domain-containing protein n=1 Tax=Adhaeribacter swui TaxID=2086471 RepID=A0A7G7GC52_9BACT|nr:cupin domain-containing protein [Adhaeribacter swui]QNF34736.1 cupin domain-containing protein [Adhaeribacter swui]